MGRHACGRSSYRKSKTHVITVNMLYKQSRWCALSLFCPVSAAVFQPLLGSSQWHYPAEIILCPFSELVPWHWAMGKCIRIDYLSCRQVWLCRRLSYWFSRCSNNAALLYWAYSNITAPSWDVVTLVNVVYHSASSWISPETPFAPLVKTFWRMPINSVRVSGSKIWSGIWQFGQRLICRDCTVDNWGVAHLTGRV